MSVLQAIQDLAAVLARDGYRLTEIRIEGRVVQLVEVQVVNGPVHVWAPYWVLNKELDEIRGLG